MSNAEMDFSDLAMESSSQEGGTVETETSVVDSLTGVDEFDEFGQLEGIAVSPCSTPKALEEESESSSLEGTEDTEESESELEQRWLSEIRAAEEEISSLAVEVANAELDLKGLKKEYKEAVKSFRLLKTGGPESLRVRKVQSDESEGGSSEPKPIDYPIDDDWRAIRTVDVIRGVEGIGPKKAEALLSMYPTLGELEDGRGEASKQCKHFSKALPEGFGEKLADLIENAMLDAIQNGIGMKGD